MPGMKQFLQILYRKKNVIYRIFLVLAASAVVLYFFPRGGSFKYEFSKGKPWMHENLYAPFDFPIYKTDEELQQEREQITAHVIPYYNYDSLVVEKVKIAYADAFDTYFKKIPKRKKQKAYDLGLRYIDSVYATGVIVSDAGLTASHVNIIKQGNKTLTIETGALLRIDSLQDALKAAFPEEYQAPFYELFFQIFSPNVYLNKDITRKAIDETLKGVSLTRGMVDKGTRVALKGEIVEADTYKKLDSLSREYHSQIWSESRYPWLIGGYVALILLATSFLMFFVERYYNEVFIDNSKITFIYFNVVFNIAITHFVMSIGPQYVYAAPLCILPLVLGAFLRTRISFITQVITLLLLGFIVPNSFEFLFIQIAASLVALVSPTEIYKRANLFIIVGKIVAVYMVTYLAFELIKGDLSYESIRWERLLLFLVNGLSILLVQPLIYIYEKMFGMVSNLSLLELSDTNSKLLNELSEKAPGTFYHSLQVANLAEMAATELEANALLVRVGALYHDIGKMKNPAYFTENQLYIANPHDDITPKESAKIIIDHVIDGIESAKKHNLPDRVIDFIRTHHGTSLVKFFYFKEKELNPQCDPLDFAYPGPIPFSKETAIIMMADSVEAGSRSLKQPNQAAIDELVEKIISSQIKEGQFLNADITLKQIESVKKIFKKKLANIYKLRIEYPE